MYSASPETSFDIDACLVRVRRSDQQAARELVEHLYPLVISIVKNRLPRRESAEDLLQEVFLKMFHRLHQYRGAVPFSHWVSRIAVTTCIDHLRSQRARPEYRWSDLTEAEADTLTGILADEREPAPGSALVARDLVDKLLSQLRPDDRLIIQMIDLERKSMAAISAVTGWNIQVVKTRAFRARRKLQKLFHELERQEEHPVASLAFSPA